MLVGFRKLLLIYVCSSGLLISQSEQKKLPKNSYILFTGQSHAGLYSNIMCLAEWLWIVENDPRLGISIQMKDYFQQKDNIYPLLFKQAQEPRVTTQETGVPAFIKVKMYPGGPWHIRDGRWVRERREWIRKYPTDGLGPFDEKKFMYGDSKTYKSPEFQIFRKRMLPILQKYFQPQDGIANKLDEIKKLISRKKTIGIHIRYVDHLHQNDGKICYPVEDYLSNIMSSVDAIMNNYDPENTQIYLASLIQPVIDMISSKYPTITINTPRTNDINDDWDIVLKNSEPLENAQNAVIDAFSLSFCDEFYCSASNMAFFSSCLNPQMPVHILPCFNDWYGR